MDEASGLPKMGEKLGTFVAKALEYAQSNPKFALSYVNIPELKKDLVALNDLTKIAHIAFCG